MLDDISQVMPLADRLRYGTGIFVGLALLGGLLLQLLRNRACMAHTLERFGVLGAALESSPMAVVITDAHGHIEWVNPQFERSTGYALAQVLGRKPSLLASGKAPPEMFRDMWSVLLQGHAWKGHFINRRSDGSEYHNEATLTPVLDRHGTCIAIVGLHQDVTERMQEQQELLCSERQLTDLLQEQNAIFDSAPPLLLSCDGQVRKFNPALAALLGPMPVSCRACAPASCLVEWKPLPRLPRVWRRSFTTANRCARTGRCAGSMAAGWMPVCRGAAWKCRAAATPRSGSLTM